MHMHRSPVLWNRTTNRRPENYKEENTLVLPAPFFVSVLPRFVFLFPRSIFSPLLLRCVLVTALPLLSAFFLPILSGFFFFPLLFLSVFPPLLLCFAAPLGCFAPSSFASFASSCFRNDSACLRSTVVVVRACAPVQFPFGQMPRLSSAVFLLLSLSLPRPFFAFPPPVSFPDVPTFPVLPFEHPQFCCSILPGCAGTALLSFASRFLPVWMYNFP
mmetsp:Transcript_35755/g.93208  ORF Transcript_35755/g.93208 Transcript_35755/m.93208 type:complete len:216 (-) Transcript_35755:342-989(-)